MTDFDPPSFSLGFDFDISDDSEPPQLPTTENDNPYPSSQDRLDGGNICEYGNDDEFEIQKLTVVDSDDEDEVLRPKLKRLKRVEETVVSSKGKSTMDLCSGSGLGKNSVDLCSGLGSGVVDDDDIEDFSSPEDDRIDEHPSTQHYSVCKSSKFSLNGLGVLSKQSGKRKQKFSNVSNAPESVITSCSKPPFPKLTVSPLRKFQLIDSDSDSDIPSISKVATNKTCNKSELFVNRGQHAGLNEHRKLNESINTSTRKDLWEDFRHEKSFHIPTPALDEVCEEYFSSMKDKNKSQSNIGTSNQNSHVISDVIDLDDPRPPAHQYFFHNDLRVQELVRTRLRNFFPLNAANRGSDQPSTSNIDYMGQFTNGEKSKQAARTNKAETSSRKNSRISKTRDMPQGYMNPKVGVEKRVPQDAGKRRVQADGQASGHWFTNGDGKRVYVSKNGQEMTGKAAYIHYKKESGAGFKNKRTRKASTKKK